MTCELTSEGFLLRKSDRPFSQWSVGVSSILRAACATLSSLAEESSDELLSGDGATFSLPHSDATGLAEAEALALGLPPRSPFSLSIQHRGTLASPDFRFKYQLFNDGRPLIAFRRIGCVVQVGSQSWRLSAAHFALLDGMDALNDGLGNSMEERMRVFARFECFLSAKAIESVNVSGYLAATHVSVAGAFSLRLRVQDGGFRLEPVLHANAPTDETHPPELLPPEQHATFLRDYESGRGRYAIGDSHYLVVEDDLQRALDLVAEIQTRSDGHQTDFLRNPRAFLRAEYGDSLPDEVLDSLFVETPQYLSDRVKGIGRWDPPVIPWVKLPANTWLPPEEVGIEVGGVRVAIKATEADEIIRQVEQAIQRGEPQVDIRGQSVPATPESLEALRKVKSLATTSAEEIQREPRKPAGRTVLLIERDFDETGDTTHKPARNSSTDLWLPLGLQSTLKPHQESGLRWLQNTWRDGRSGVLLADDMGLGKTLQCLAFLLWLRHANAERASGEGGFLIIAPTGLLKNWEQEYETHLDESGHRLLGRPLAAYGAGLKRLKSGSSNDLARGGVSLRTDEIASAGWVLTTYETLRDYHHSFATIRWQVLVFDEAQKIKTPGTLVSEAAKAMNADYTLALTGTPVENRYADLWSIVNTVDRGSLSVIGGGSLREFSSKFEASPGEDDLRELRIHLTEPEGRSLMLRRMKQDILDGLPAKTEVKALATMPPEQARLYAEAVASARSIRERGAMLKALQEFRAISLHPWLMSDEEPSDLTAFATSSARVMECFRLLREIQTRGEKALVFVDSRRLQKWLRVVMPTEFGLAEPPACISGEVPGIRRQAMVNTFQALPAGFAVILLSPRAAGVGLTLTAANNVIHLDRWWNPAVEDQCTDRVYRIGQTKAVQVSLPIARHPDPQLAETSFDLTLDRLMQRKRAQSRDLLNPVAMSDKDTADLFRDVCGTI
jgi:superfamily II DNA or RNA helicase